MLAQPLARQSWSITLPFCSEYSVCSRCLFTYEKQVNTFKSEEKLPPLFLSWHVPNPGRRWSHLTMPVCQSKKLSSEVFLPYIFFLRGYYSSQNVTCEQAPSLSYTDKTLDLLCIHTRVTDHRIWLCTLKSYDSCYYLDRSGSS